MTAFVQLTFPVNCAQATQNGACAPPALPVGGSRPGGSCGRCVAMSASPTAPATGAVCTSCRFAADHAGRRCAVCGGPIPPGKKPTARYCSRRCRDRGPDWTAGVPLERERCRCDRPLLVLDPDLGETRCLHCGRT